MKKNRIAKNYVDDGHTVYSMDGVSDNRPKAVDIGLTRKERRVLKWTAFVAYLPYLLMVLGCFTVAMLILSFWL